MFAKRLKDANALQNQLSIQKITIPSDKCPFGQCDGSGWIWYKDWSKRNKETNEKDEWLEECECNKELELKRKLRFAKIPEKFQGITVQSFDTSIYESAEAKEIAALAKKAAINYLKHFDVMKENGKGLYLSSHTKGCGKTRLISSIANALIKHYKTNLIFLTAEGLLKELKKTFDTKESSTELISLFQTVDVLVIDDFGVEAGNEGATDWVERTFTDILDERLVSKRITLFTSNFRVNELDRVYKAGRISGRIKEMTLEVYMPEEKIRERKAELENQQLESLLFR
jgi:DNA replication protein DnaC